MRRYLCRGVLLGVLLVRQSPAQLDGLADEWRWAHFGLSSGLPSLQIINLIELPNGIPWVHTRTGLAWYNGYRWESIPLDSALSAGIGHGTMSAGFDGVLFTVPPYLYHVTPSGATLLHPSRHGDAVPVMRACAVGPWQIMLQSDTGLFVQKGDSTIPLQSPYQHQLVGPPDSQFGLYQTGNGGVWLNSPRGLYRWMPTGWDPWYLPPGGSPLNIHLIVENARGDGVLLGRLETRYIKMEWFSGRSADTSVTEMPAVIGAADIAPDGSIISLEGSGLAKHRINRVWQVAGTPIPQMMNAYVLRFRSNGDLWVGKDGGLLLCRLSSRRWTTLNADFSSATGLVNDILLLPDSTLWAGTGDGIVVYHHDRSPEWINRAAGRRLGIITGIARDNEGNIWVASGASYDGVMRWNGKTWKHFGVAEGFVDTRIHKICRDRKGRLWFLTISSAAPGTHPESERGAFVLDGGKFTRIAAENGLLDNRLYSFAEDTSGAQWFGSLKGISRHKHGRWRHWTEEDGLISSKIFSLAADSSGRIWFGHQFSGLGYIDVDGTIRYVHQHDGLTSRSIWNIVAAKDGKLWIATRDGLFINNHGVWASFGIAEGIPNPHLWPIVVTSHVAYLGTSGSGVAVFDYASLDVSPPRVNFGKPVVQGATGIINWRVHVPWEEVPTSTVRNRYRLDDQPWSEWSDVRSVTLSELGLGWHTLSVQGKGAIGQISPTPESLAFEVPPPWFLRPQFYVPVAVLLLTLAGLLLTAVRKKRQYDVLLREQDARFRAVVEHQTELILRVLPDGTVSFVNEAFCRFLGRSREDLVGESFAVLVAGGKNDGFTDPLLQATPSDGVIEHDMLLQPPGGAGRWIRWSSSAIPGTGESVSERQLIGRDITDRKAAEELLVRSEARYRIVAEQTGQMVYDADIATGAIAWLGALEAVTGYTGEEFRHVTMHRWRELMHEEDRQATAAAFDRCVALGEHYQHMYRVRHKNGSYISVLANGIPIAGPDGKVNRVLGTIMDITERRRAESVIAASLREKEVLLKEIHHRVKNNLQVISSLLNLQAASIQDAKTLEQLQESQNRIRSMALIHERLYQSDNLAHIDFGEYVRGLVGYLARSYSVPLVRVTIDVQHIDLAVNTAIPCGLIINELVSNALKYAFPDGRTGEVRIRLVVDGARLGVLTVQDDGVGLPPTIDVEHTPTLGLQLVNTLTRQLNGTAEVTRETGTSFSITFPVES